MLADLTSPQLAFTCPAFALRCDASRMRRPRPRAPHVGTLLRRELRSAALAPELVDRNNMQNLRRARNSILMSGPHGWIWMTPNFGVHTTVQVDGKNTKKNLLW